MNLAELPLAEFFLKQLLEQPVAIADLAVFDHQVYDNVSHIIRQPEASIRDMDLTFVTQQSNPITGTNSTIELIPGGSTKEVVSTVRFLNSAN